MAKQRLKTTVKACPPAAWIARRLLTLAASYRYLRDFVRFRALDREQRFPARWRDCFPCLHDRTAGTGFDPHYIYHPAWAARVLAETRPAEHVDISSSLHFCSQVSAFLPVRFFDYRPVELGLREFSLVPDAPAPYGLIRHADPALVQEQVYGCGCFWFRKIT